MRFPKLRDKVPIPTIGDLALRQIIVNRPEMATHKIHNYRDDILGLELEEEPWRSQIVSALNAELKRRYLGLECDQNTEI